MPPTPAVRNTRLTTGQLVESLALGKPGFPTVPIPIPHDLQVLCHGSERDDEKVSIPDLARRHRMTIAPPWPARTFDPPLLSYRLRGPL